MAKTAWVGSEEVPPETDAALRQALTPALEDLERTTGIGLTVDLRRQRLVADEWECTVFPEGKTWDDFEVEMLSRASVTVRREDPTPRRIAMAAWGLETLATEEWFARSGRGGWPECPRHSHQLRPDVHGDEAVWLCPSGEFSARIGSLGSTS